MWCCCRRWFCLHSSTNDDKQKLLTEDDLPEKQALSNKHRKKELEKLLSERHISYDDFKTIFEILNDGTYAYDVPATLEQICKTSLHARVSKRNEEIYDIVAGEDICSKRNHGKLHCSPFEPLVPHFVIQNDIWIELLVRSVRTYVNDDVAICKIVEILFLFRPHHMNLTLPPDLLEKIEDIVKFNKNANLDTNSVVKLYYYSNSK